MKSKEIIELPVLFFTAQRQNSAAACNAVRCRGLLDIFKSLSFQLQLLILLFKLNKSIFVKCQIDQIFI